MAKLRTRSRFIPASGPILPPDPILSPAPIRVQAPIPIAVVTISDSETESAYSTVPDSITEPEVALTQDPVDEAGQQSDVAPLTDWERDVGPFNQLGLPENQYWGAHLPPSSVNGDGLADVQGKYQT